MQSWNLNPSRYTEADRQLIAWVIFVTVFLDYCAVGMMRSLLPWYSTKLGGGAVLLGLLETAYGFGQVIGASFLGRLSDTKGRRVVLALSCVGSAVGYGVAAFATSASVLVASRVPVGLAKQTATVARAILADITPTSERTTAMVRLMIPIASGYALGPIIGAKLASWYDDDTPAYFASGLFWATIPCVFVFLPETAPAMSGSDGAVNDEISVRKAVKPAVSFWVLFQQPQISRIVLATILPEFALIVYSTTAFAMFGIEILGANRDWLALHQTLMAVGAGLHSLVTIPYLVSARGWSDRDLLRVGYLIFGFCSLTYCLFVSKLGALAILPVLSLATAIFRSIPASFASKIIGPGDQGSVLGLLDGASSVCRVLAPLLTGLLIDATNNFTPFYLISCFSAGGWLAITVLFDGTSATSASS